MNGYIAFYAGRKAEFLANTSYAALVMAQKYFKPPKSKLHTVHVMLAEKDGAPVVHDGAELP